MARRRRFGGRRAQRRRTFWTVPGDFGGVSFNETAGINTAAGVSRDRTEIALLSDQDSTFTLVRIVGGVHVSLQAAPASAVPVFWGFYTAQSGGGGSLRLDARTDADVSEENWLHWRPVWLFGADLTLNRTDDMVDIKVMRKFEAGKELHWNGRSQSAWHSGVALRFLLMAT